MTQTIESALDFLSKLVDVDLLNQGLIEAALGIALQFDAAHSTHAYDFYRYERSKSAASTNVIQSVDFRVPANPEATKGEFLYMSLVPTDGLNASAIIQYLGSPLKIIPATPQERAGTGRAVSYVYWLGKKDVIFSFAPPPQETLLSIRLERHQ